MLTKQGKSVVRKVTSGFCRISEPVEMLNKSFFVAEAGQMPSPLGKMPSKGAGEVQQKLSCLHKPGRKGTIGVSQKGGL